LIGVGADDGDRPDVLAERQRVAVILEQHDRLAGDLAREVAVRRLIEHREGDAGPAHALERVEHPQLHAGDEEPAHRRVDLALGDEALLHRVDELRVDAAEAVEVRLVLHAERGGLLGCRP
jgi:hypothetical protein